MNLWLSIVTSWVAHFALASAFGTNPQLGKSACVYLYPSGHGAAPQSSAAPYNLVISSDTYTPGGNLTVSISGGPPFRGFIIQGRSVADVTQKVGDFLPTDDAKINCVVEGWGGKTITHVDPSEKVSQTVTWTAPDQSAGDVQFRATVVQVQSTYWANITSRVIRDVSTSHGTSDNISQETPTMSIITGDTPAESRTDPSNNSPSQPAMPLVDLTQCGVSKACYRAPTDCEADLCDYVLTWALQGADLVSFELQGTVTDEQKYLAVGLSLDIQMGDDSVVDCLYTGDDVKPFVIQHSYNIPNDKSNTLHNQPQFGLVSDSLLGYYGDGRITCYFKLPVHPEDGADDRVFPLNQEYHLLFAKGSVDDGVKGYHAESKIASASMINVTSGELVNIGGTTGYPLVKAHGVMMIVAWMVCASFAVLMPRYFKKSWPGKKCSGKDLWFAIHQSLMLAVLVLTVSGFVLIFIHVRGYAQYSELPSRAHAPLGITTTALVILNPTMAFFRPGPGAPRRPIFNFCHFCVGLAAHVISVATMYIGINLPKAAMPSWSVKIMGAYVVWHILIEISLAIHKHCCNKREDTSSYAMKQLGDNDPMAKSPDQHQVAGLQTGIAVLHIVGVFTLSMALIIPLVMA